MNINNDIALKTIGILSFAHRLNMLDIYRIYVWQIHTKSIGINMHMIVKLAWWYGYTSMPVKTVNIYDFI